MKHLRKLAVLAVALVAVLALSAVAWADDGLDITDNNDNTFTIEFTKEIKALGSTGTLYSPQVTYTYSVDSALNGEALEAAVNPVAPTISVGDVTFNQTPATSNSKFTATGRITATIDNTTTHNAFIYKIDEADPGKAALGIREEGTSSSVSYNNSRYLILVVGDPDLTDGVAETEVLTAYLYKANNDEQDPDLKVPGWTVVTGETYDKYETATVTIRKEITGKYADPNVAFSFSVQVACNNGGKVTYDSASQGTDMGTAYQKGLANNGTITITGVPAYASAQVKVTEQNNTTSTYNLTTSGLDTNISDPLTMAPNATYEGTKSISSMDAVQIIYTNELPDISTTGLVLRVAPYAIVVGAGAALFFVARRREERVY